MRPRAPPHCPMACLSLCAVPPTWAEAAIHNRRRRRCGKSPEHVSFPRSSPCEHRGEIRGLASGAPVLWRAPEAARGSRRHAQSRQPSNKTSTRQVAASHVQALINARHKRTTKMPWTREGAHHVLHIRALMASDAWESTCQDAVRLARGAAV